MLRARIPSALSVLLALVAVAPAQVAPGVPGRAPQGPQHAPVVKPEPHTSVPDFLGWVQDEAVVVLFPEAARHLSVGQGPDGRPAVGDALLQGMLDMFDASAFRRQFPTARPQTPGSVFPDLTGHFKVRFPTSVPLDVVVDTLGTHPMVDHVERIGIHSLYQTPDDTYYDDPPGSFPYDQWHYWNANSIDAETAWGTSTGDQDVLVGILDSGTRYFHADLGGFSAPWGPSAPFADGNVFINPGEVPGNGLDDDGNGFVDDTVGWDFVSTTGGFGVTCIDQDCGGVDNDPDDGDGHGTHVAGTVGAITNNGYLVAGVAGGFSDASGVGNGVSLVPLRIGYHANYFGQTTGIVRMDWAAEAMNYLADLVDAGHNVASINCSWGSSNSGGLDAAVDNLVAHDVVICAAAGNSGSSSAPFLGTKAGVLNVAATDINGNGASFSNYGSWVDVAAPGMDVLSTYRNPDDPDPNANYIALLSGTSMSSPHVAGIAALLESCNVGLTAADKRALIVNNTEPYSDPRDLGSGIANARLALDAAACGTTPCDVVADFSGTPTSGCAALQVAFTDLSTGSVTGWSWDFGDGNTSTLQDPVHTYAAAGTYTVSLTASSAVCSEGVTKTGYVTVGGAPVADFTASGTSGEAPFGVAFTDLSGGAPTQWIWDFGDGNGALQQDPTHLYTAAGTYTVTLTASNACGSDTLVRTDYITVTEPCDVVADFVGSPTSGCASLAVSFTDTSAGSATSWSWDFGDGNTSTAQNPVHTYAAPGTYTVSLTATSAVCSDSVTKPAYVTVDGGPTAGFSGSPTSGTTPLTVQFTDASTDATSWSWDFGDGGTSTAQDPSHTYTAAGSYTVTLTVTNACGSDSLVRSGYVTVDDPVVPTTMHVGSLLVTKENLAKGFKRGVAVVTVVDEGGSPVPGATVSGVFSGKSNESASGTTDAAGQVTLFSGDVKGGGGEWCFEVTNVTHASLTYDSADNVATQACESGTVF